MLRNITLALVMGAILCIPFWAILFAGYFNDAPPALGVFTWIIVIIFGFPWNIGVFFLAGGIDTYFGSDIFRSLNENHDKTVGVLMFVGYVSVYINCVIVALVLNARRLREVSGAIDGKNNNVTLG